MPKQPIAVELEAINREGEIQVVRGSARSALRYLRMVLRDSPNSRAIALMP